MALLGGEERTGIRLTESMAMWPGASVSGWYFAHPAEPVLRRGPPRARPGGVVCRPQGVGPAHGRALAGPQPGVPARGLSSPRPRLSPCRRRAVRRRVGGLTDEVGRQGWRGPRCRGTGIPCGHDASPLAEPSRGLQAVSAAVPVPDDRPARGSALARRGARHPRARGCSSTSSTCPPPNAHRAPPRPLLEPRWRALVEERPELSAMIEDSDELTEESWFAGARTLVEQWFDLEDPTRLVPAARELYVETEVEGLTLRGYVDRLDVAPDGAMRVVDYKTGRSPGEAFEAKALFQMKFYALVLWRIHGEVPRSCSWSTSATARSSATPPTRATCSPSSATSAPSGMPWSAPPHRDWRPRTSRLCDWCDFRDLCPAWGGPLPPCPRAPTRSRSTPPTQARRCPPTTGTPGGASSASSPNRCGVRPASESRCTAPGIAGTETTCGTATVGTPAATADRTPSGCPRWRRSPRAPHRAAGRRVGTARGAACRGPPRPRSRRRRRPRAGHRRPRRRASATTSSPGRSAPLGTQGVEQLARPGRHGTCSRTRATTRTSSSSTMRTGSQVMGEWARMNSAETSRSLPTSGGRTRRSRCRRAPRRCRARRRSSTARCRRGCRPCPTGRRRAGSWVGSLRSRRVGL